MSLTAITGMLGPSFPHLRNSGLGFDSNVLIDATAEKAACIFQVPKTGTLDKVEFRVGAVTFPATSALRVSFQDVAAAGDADGTQDQFRDVTSLSANTWTVPGLMTSDGTDTGTKRSVTRGQWLAVVWEYSTFVATGSVIISALVKSSGGYALPFMRLNTGSWANVSSVAPVIALKYDDGTYAYMTECIPASAVNATTFSSSSTPDERGLYFSWPTDVRICGARGSILPAAAGRDFNIVLYQQGNDTPLATLSVDADQVGSNTFAPGVNLLFASSVELTANTNYRLVVKPTTTGQITLYDFDVNAAAMMDALDGGQAWHFTSRTDGATTGGTLSDGWTQTTTKRPMIAPLFDAFPGAGMIFSRVRSGF